MEVEKIICKKVLGADVRKKVVFGIQLACLSIVPDLPSTSLPQLHSL